MPLSSIRSQWSAASRRVVRKPVNLKPCLFDRVSRRSTAPTAQGLDSEDTGSDSDSRRECQSDSDPEFSARRTHRAQLRSRANHGHGSHQAKQIERGLADAYHAADSGGAGEASGAGRSGGRAPGAHGTCEGGCGWHVGQGGGRAGTSDPAGSDYADTGVCKHRRRIWRPARALPAVQRHACDRRELFWSRVCCVRSVVLSCVEVVRLGLALPVTAVLLVLMRTSSTQDLKPPNHLFWQGLNRVLKSS